MRNLLMRAQYQLINNEYKKLYKLVNKNINRLHMNKSNNKLSTKDKTNLKILEKSFDRACNNIAATAKSTLIDNMNSLCEEVVEEVQTELGIEIDDSVISDTIDAILLGLIYNTNWTLSDAIEKAINSNEELIKEIIEAGIEDEKSESEIVQDILNVIDPNSNQQLRSYKSKHKTLYVGKADYKLQRLLRTTLEHSFQKIIVETAKVIPEKTMIRWISALEPNTCEVCESRHNKLYEINDLPLEHPNGQCDFQIEIL